MDSYTLSELAEACETPIRTVRYYIAQGILPPPEGSGRWSTYTTEHLHSLQLIRSLQQEHLPLAEIRKRMEALDPEAIRRLTEPEVEIPAPQKDFAGPLKTAATDTGADSPAESAADSAVAYLDRLLGGTTEDLRGQVDRTISSRARETPPPKTESRQRDSDHGSAAHSTWQHIHLDPDLEIHVRRPLSRRMNRHLAQIIAFAQTVLARTDRSSTHHPEDYL